MAGDMNILEETVLGMAIAKGDPQHVSTLLDMGEDVHFKDQKGNTYLHYTCTIYKPYVIHVLISAGVDINAQNRDGNTALHVTALHAESCHVPDLMMRGVDPSIKNKQGKLASNLAQANSYWTTLYNRYQPGLRKAIEQHDVPRVKELLQSWCAVDVVQYGKDMRQFAAALKFHDLVKVIDHYRWSLTCVYGVLEVNYPKLKKALARPECEINFVRKDALLQHTLQHAIRLNNYKMVSALLKRGADINIRVHIKEYARGPLFFEVLAPTRELNSHILWTVLEYGPDLQARDEHGRTALIYAVENYGKGTDLKLVNYLLDKGSDLAARDKTGCCARDIALFARQYDVISLLDKHYIQMVKDSDIIGLSGLAARAYDHFIVDYELRDTWIYAAGNETDDATQFLQGLEKLQELYNEVHQHVMAGDLTKLKSLVKSSDSPENILHCQDKGGRTPLLIACLYNQCEVVQYLLSEEPELIHDKDNCERTALHYASAWDQQGAALQRLLLNHGAVPDALDVKGNRPEDCINLSFITEEKQALYGMELELHCLQKYEALLEVINTPDKDLKDFLKVLKNLRHPVANFCQLFHRGRHQLVAEYRDLLLCALEKSKVDIAKKLVDIGVPCSSVQEWDEAKGKLKPINAIALAKQLGFHELSEHMLKRSLQSVKIKEGTFGR